MILVIVIQTQSFEGILCDTDSPDGCSGAHEHWQPDFGTDYGKNAFQPLTQRNLLRNGSDRVHSGGLESGDLESGGLESGGLES